MQLLNDLRIQLDQSEYRMLTTLCGYLSPSEPIMTIERLRDCVGEMNAEPPKHDMAGLAQELLLELLREAEELYGVGRCH